MATKRRRRKFTEREAIRTLLLQGADIRCFRTGEKITLENVEQLQREHLHEFALGGPDIPENCRFSLKEAHAIVTNGNGATTAGSSQHRLAKTRGTRAEKFSVNKLSVDAARPEKRRRFGSSFRVNA